ncbi:hypothetical protein PRUPE_7G127900, partial [Prunus persica]
GKKTNSDLPDSNQRPKDNRWILQLQSSALPTELRSALLGCTHTLAQNPCPPFFGFITQGHESMAFSFFFFVNCQYTPNAPSNKNGKLT